MARKQPRSEVCCFPLVKDDRQGRALGGGWRLSPRLSGAPALLFHHLSQTRGPAPPLMTGGEFWTRCSRGGTGHSMGAETQTLRSNPWWVKNPPAMQETQVQPLGGEDPPGEGNGNPLQYSYLEDPMGRGAWWATVHGATESRTQLSN